MGIKDYNKDYYQRNRLELVAKQAKWRESHKAENLAALRRWKEEHLRPCKDCGKLCSPRAIRCKGCASRHSLGKKLGKRKNYFCIDCGVSIVRARALRCKKCYGLVRRRKKGGDERCRIATGGYILILKPEHPRADCKGFVLEHILIWEQVHGKPLPKGWIVHHFNGIKGDNRPKNLFAMTNKQHRLIIPLMAKRIQELEGLLKNQHQLL